MLPSAYTTHPILPTHRRTGRHQWRQSQATPQYPRLSRSTRSTVSWTKQSVQSASSSSSVSSCQPSSSPSSSPGTCYAMIMVRRTMTSPAAVAVAASLVPTVSTSRQSSQVSKRSTLWLSTTTAPATCSLQAALPPGWTAARCTVRACPQPHPCWSLAQRITGQCSLSIRVNLRVAHHVWFVRASNSGYLLSVGPISLPCFQAR
jgi:hypothetical protein